LHITEEEAEAEELTQDVFLKIWSGRHLLRDVENADGYLFVMARNASLDAIQKRTSESNMRIHLQTRNPSSENSTELEIDLNETGKLLEQAVRNLPPQQETIYRLSKEEGLTRQEIASRLHISENTVRNHLAAAIQSIKAWLKSHDRLVMFYSLWHWL
jgi:RNA polymerase sigma-70 factor (family 1)